jgi:hypothetical protein
LVIFALFVSYGYHAFFLPGSLFILVILFENCAQYFEKLVFENKEGNAIEFLRSYGEGSVLFYWSPTIYGISGGCVCVCVCV